MKKVIAILMIACIMLCGCSKNETTSIAKNDPTSSPTSEPTNAPTSEPTAVPDSDLTPTLTLEELTDVINQEVNDARKNADIDNYDTLLMAVQIAFTNKDVYPLLKDIKGRIIVNNDGITYEDIPEAVSNEIKNVLGAEITTYGEYIIGIDGNTVRKEKAPQ